MTATSLVTSLWARGQSLIYGFNPALVVGSPPSTVDTDLHHAHRHLSTVEAGPRALPPTRSAAGWPTGRRRSPPLAHEQHLVKAPPQRGAVLLAGMTAREAPDEASLTPLGPPHRGIGL